MEAYCIWTEDKDGVWESDCGSAFVFNDGGPKENRFKACPYCGELIAEARQEVSDE